MYLPGCALIFESECLNIQTFTTFPASIRTYDSQDVLIYKNGHVSLNISSASYRILFVAYLSLLLSLQRVKVQRRYG